MSLRQSAQEPRCNRVRVAWRIAWFVAIALIIAGTALGAEELNSSAGFFVELPEGFKGPTGDGLTQFSFTDPNSVLLFQIILYDPARYATARAIHDATVSRLKAVSDAEDFVYQRRKAVLADLTFNAGGAANRGYALFVDGLPKNAIGKPDRDFLLIAYAPADQFDGYQDFMLSCLDGFSIDREARLYPGPVSQFDTPWDPSRRTPVSISYNGSTLSVPYDPAESEAAQMVVEREFRVLAAYAGVDRLDDLAWARFYRMAYRDCYHRLDYLALAVAQANMAAARSGALPDARARAKAVLTWTQGFSYERTEEGADFVNPLTAAFEARGDCDARAVLIAALLRHDGVDAILMLSRKFSHALAGVDVDGPGARFPFESKRWLVAETTSRVDLGLIAADIADPAEWLGVLLPE